MLGALFLRLGSALAVDELPTNHLVNQAGILTSSPRGCSGVITLGLRSARKLLLSRRPLRLSAVAQRGGGGYGCQEGHDSPACQKLFPVWSAGYFFVRAFFLHSQSLRVLVLLCSSSLFSFVLFSYLLCFLPGSRPLAAPSDLRKAWKWDDRPGVAKMLNDVADSMAATGFNDEAADLFERCGGGGGRCLDRWIVQ